jgi:hypothetical protein
VLTSVPGTSVLVASFATVFAVSSKSINSINPPRLMNLFSQFLRYWASSDC